MKNDNIVCPFYTDQPVGRDRSSPESKITKSQPENEFHNQPPKLMPNMWYFLLQLPESFLQSYICIYFLFDALLDLKWLNKRFLTQSGYLMKYMPMETDIFSEENVYFESLTASPFPESSALSRPPSSNFVHLLWSSTFARY